VSFDAVKWALGQPVTPPAAKLTLVALGLHADRDGYAWPTVGTLAGEVGVCDGYVRRHIAALAAAGLVEKKERPRRDDGTFAGWLYRLEMNDQRAPSRAGPARTESRWTSATNQRDPSTVERKEESYATRARAHARGDGPAVDNGPDLTAAERAEYQAKVRALRAELRETR
jgi:predicted ArsR family transcriptional regulator